MYPETPRVQFLKNRPCYLKRAKDCPCTLVVVVVVVVVIIIIIIITSMTMYQNKSKRSREGKVITYWNEQVQTARTIPKNKQDIIIRDNEKL